MLDRRIKLRHLEAFAAIARAGSLKSACAELHLTQPALSKTLKELETVLGARLMQRDRGGVTLTPAGEVLLDEARAGLAALRRGIDGVAALERGEGAALSVGALPSVSAWLLPQALLHFRTLAPGVRLTLRDGGHGPLTADLREGRLDTVIGRLGAPRTMQGLTFTQLYVERVVCAVRPAHPLLHRAGLTQASLCDHPVIYPPEGAAIRPLVDRWWLASGAPPPPDRIDSVSGAFGRNVVQMSDAVWIISEGVVARDVADGRLAVLPLDTALTEGPVGLMTRADAPPAQAQRLLARALDMTLQDHSLPPPAS